MEERGTKAYIAEFIGTFLLVMAITMVVAIYAPNNVFVVIGLVHAFVLMMLVQTLAGISGAHFNPAVTAAMAALRKIKPIDGLIYIILQLAGGICGALFTKLVLLDEGKSTNYGATTINPEIGGALQGLAVETLFTFVLVWSIVGLVLNPRAARDWAGWVIGATLGFLVLIAAPLTGAGFNPARSFGPAVVSGQWSDFWVYVTGPIVGGVAAALLYSSLFIKRGT